MGFKGKGCLNMIYRWQPQNILRIEFYL